MTGFVDPPELSLDEVDPSCAFWSNVSAEYISSLSLNLQLPVSHPLLSQDSPYHLIRDEILSLIPPSRSSYGRNIDGNVMDALLLMLGCAVSKQGINVATLPSHFLCTITRDLSQEFLLPHTLDEHHCVSLWHGSVIIVGWEALIGEAFLLRSSW